MHEDVHVWCSTFKKPVIGAGAGTLLLEKAPSAPLSLWSTRSCCWWLMELDGKRKDYGHQCNWSGRPNNKQFEDFMKMKICTSTSSPQSGVNASVSLQRPQADWKGISTSSTWWYVTISIEVLSSSAQSHHNVMCSSQFDCFADWAGKTMNLNQEMDWSHLWLTVHHPISWLTRLNKECVLLTEIAVVPTKAASHCATRRFGEQCWKSPFYPEQGQ